MHSIKCLQSDLIRCALIGISITAELAQNSGKEVVSETVVTAAQLAS